MYLCQRPRQLNNLETSYFKRGREGPSIGGTKVKAEVKVAIFFSALNCCLTSLYLRIPGKLILDLSKDVLTNFFFFFSLGSWISICIWSRSQF